MPDARNTPEFPQPEPSPEPARDDQHAHQHAPIQDATPENQKQKKRRWNPLGGVWDHVKRMGADAASVALGKLLEPPLENPTHDDNTEEEIENGSGKRRVHVLHQVTEQLRGAADTYIAAKLDEIEARVDTKLEEIDSRIDQKLVNLHRQLADMRDRELRHRLRLLKITLIFTVLVAALSLLYKWLSKTWFT